MSVSGTTEATGIDTDTPRGVLARVVDASVTLTTSGTTESAIPDITATVTVEAGRVIEISGHILATGSVAGDQFDVRTKKDGSTVQISIMTIPTASQAMTWTPLFVDVSPTAGSHTYHFTLIRRSGTGTATVVAASDAPAILLVKDIGAA